MIGCVDFIALHAKIGDSIGPLIPYGVLQVSSTKFHLKMTRHRMYAPVGNHTERLRRRFNAAEDMAAMYRLERSMAFAAENQRAQHVQPPDIESRNDTFEQDGENYNLQPGLEDDQEDEDFEALDTWVTLEREESPDAINSMIQASNEYYRQRAKERNFNRLFNDLHPVYLIQKNKTSNWASSSTYIDFSPPCKCQTRRNRVVDLIDLYGQRRKRVDFCDCTLDGVRLMYLGYVAGSPVEPQTAFLLPLLIFHNHLWNHCNIGALPFTQALRLFLEPRSERLHVRNGQHGQDVRKPFTAAVDLYWQLEEASDALFHRVMGLDAQQTLAVVSCPACFGPQPLNTLVYPDTTRDQLVVCLDGNFQHRHHSKASSNYEELRMPNIFVTQDQVSQATDLIQEAEMTGVSETQVDCCTESHKAADDKHNESTWKGCDDTGLMGCCCHHDAAIYLAKIYKSGEQRCFQMAILKRLLAAVEPNQPIGILYDIGCTMDKFLTSRNLFEEQQTHIRFGTSIFHAYAHNWTCQLDYNPRFNKGWGLSDGEGLERMWSYFSNLVSPLRYATRNHRFASISHRLAHHNRQGIQGLAHWLRRKFNNALKRRREVRNTLAKLLAKPNPHSALGRNYSQGFFQRQWIAQRGFHADHTDVEELRMKKMASLYQRENIINLLR
ncbi:hypothetical protein PCANC_14100 [Puccinia coronata f. sp. avenae]|uniref:CxC1-like cysteine cluster associated with KDZ transposases domain-containing protein n=1 Tax=Puccinia coronata f. sp. avenae TaxID=200324 RepID=A0A2N5VRR5_9BASI|nr:hypothetical protein PCANC_14100 [Puccinia coronata f. sp. avenae]